MKLETIERKYIGREEEAFGLKATAAKKCLKKFLYYFKKGYDDATYIAWEREYKWNAYQQFQDQLNRKAFSKLLHDKNYKFVSDTAVRIESRTNLLFSFEKMALRDAVKSSEGAAAFAIGLYDYIYGKAGLEKRFQKWVEVVGTLPRKQTRVLTWPIVTVFGFIANPYEHVFLKPRVTQLAAEKYKFHFEYQSKPVWKTYKSLIDFAELVRRDTMKYHPKDYIDLQSFIWVQGSDEYPD